MPPPFPYVAAVSALTVGATPAMPSHQANDIILVLAMADSSAVTPALSVAQNFAAVTGAGQVHNETGGSLDYGGNLFWCRAASASETAPTLTNTSVTLSLVVRRVKPTGNPWNVVTANDHSAGLGSVVCNGSTTTVDTCLILALATCTAGSQSFSGWTNADLTDIQEEADVTRDGGTSGTTHTLGVASGKKATAGAFGSTTASSGTGKGHRWHVAFEPAPASASVTIR